LGFGDGYGLEGYVDVGFGVMSHDAETKCRVEVCIDNDPLQSFWHRDVEHVISEFWAIAGDQVHVCHSYHKIFLAIVNGDVLGCCTDAAVFIRCTGRQLQDP